MFVLISGWYFLHLSALVHECALKEEKHIMFVLISRQCLRLLCACACM